jgi:hypothetical protein
MDEEEFRALARQHTPSALKILASLAVDPNGSPQLREEARSMLELRLKQSGIDISPDLRRELEDILHGK